LRDSTVQAWNLATGEAISKIAGFNAELTALAAAIHHDRAVIVSGSSDGLVRIWDIPAGEPVGDALAGHTGAVTSVATVTLDNGRIIVVSGSEDATIRFWDLETGDVIEEQPVPYRVAALTAFLDEGFINVICGQSTGLLRVRMRM
jgi:WD40 repeat protein